MKTFLKRAKYFFGIGLAGVFCFSSLLALIPQQASAYNNDGCPANQVNYQNSCRSMVAATGGTCPSHTTPFPGNSSICMGPVVGKPGAPGTGGSGGGGNCSGIVSPGYTVDCSTIPPGCPGSTALSSHLDPNSTIGPCPYAPADTTWKCSFANCTFKDGTKVALNQSYADAAGVDTSGNAGSDPTGCDFNGDPLTFIICPIVKSLEKGIQWVDDFITSAMTFDTCAVFDKNCAAHSAGKDHYVDGYYKAFNSFRVIATAVLIIAGLVMLTSQALGFEFLDAYTLKKVLPRILVAIIFLTLAWPLMQFAIEFFNVFGNNIRNIMYSPFDAAVKGTLGASTLFVFGAGFGVLWVAMGPAIFTFLLTALLAVLVGFLIILVRYLAILVLITLAPIAIVCYVLPNTQKVWNLWRENFIGMLLVYPIISAFIAVGHIFSAVSTGGGGPGTPLSGTAMQAIGFIAYFLPYFLLPIAFRMASGVIGSVAGFMNDRHKGAFDRLKGARGNAVTKNAHRLSEGNRFNNTSFVGRRLNRLSHGIATAPKAGLNPARMRARYSSANASHTFNAAEEIRTKNADFALGAQDDRLLRAAQYGNGRDDIERRLRAAGITAPAELNNAAGIVERMQNSGSREAVNAAIAIQRFATGTGYNDADNNFDFQEAFNSIRDASHGDRALAGRLLGAAKGEAGRAGQLAFGGASYGTLSGQLDRSFQGREVDGEAVALNAFESNDAVTVARARTAHVQAMSRAASNRITNLQANGASARVPGGPVEQGELGRLSAQYDNFNETTGQYAAPDRQIAVNTQGAGSRTARRDSAAEYQDYVRDLASARAEGRPDPTPSANVIAYQRYRNARAGNPFDQNRPQDEG